MGECFVEPAVNTCFTECRGKFKYVGGATTAEGSDGIEVGFFDFVIVTQRTQYIFDNILILGAKWLLCCKGCHACADLARGVRHGTHYVTRIDEFAAQSRNWCAG